jgi:hypothetical protein
MGLDLALLPFESDSPSIVFSHSILNCWRRRELFDVIGKLPSVPINPEMEGKTRKDVEAEDKAKKRPLSTRFTSYLATLPNGESGYGETTHDPYGSPLRYTLAGDLVKVGKHDGVTDNARNRAVWAYLAELPPDTKVALYWH